MSAVRPPLPGGPYLVVGLARSGRAAAALLAGRGAEVIAVDRAPAPVTGLAPGVHAHDLLAHRPQRA